MREVIGNSSNEIITTGVLESTAAADAFASPVSTSLCTGEEKRKRKRNSGGATARTLVNVLTALVSRYQAAAPIPNATARGNSMALETFVLRRKPIATRETSSATKPRCTQSRAFS